MGYKRGIISGNDPIMDYYLYEKRRRDRCLELCNDFEISNKDYYEEEGLSDIFPDACEQYKKRFLEGFDKGFVMSHPDEYELDSNGNVVHK